MGRRTTLMIAAVVIAALGAAMIFLYVQGINTAAEAKQKPVQVLAATEQIEAGETIDDAAGAGKLDLKTVPEKDVLPGAVTTMDALKGQVALTTIFPGEQIFPGKFGAAGTQQTITIPDGTMAVSVQLTDPSRVAGFITPGSKVAVFMSSTGTSQTSSSGTTTAADPFTRLLLPEVDVIGVGTTTVLSTTTTDESGAATVEQLPKTLLTLALTQDQAEKVMFASGNGTLALGLLNDKSKVKSGSGVTNKSLFK
ncbi:MAG: Flp pilus assembly protein CpaB [Nocardioidaceae bacterium]